PRLARFFIKEDHSYRVVPALREVAVFTVQDVLADPPFSRLDLVCCRNLLIYLRPEAQEKVLRLFHFALREGGILFLGGSETVGRLNDLFEPIAKAQRIYRHVGRVRPGEVDFPVAAAAARPLGLPRAQKRMPQSPRLGEVAQRLLLESYAPASVLINRHNECLYYLGETDRYLRLASGEPSRDLVAMVRDGLRNKLRARPRRRHRCASTPRGKDRSGQHCRAAPSERRRGIAAGQLHRGAQAPEEVEAICRSGRGRLTSGGA